MTVRLMYDRSSFGISLALEFHFDRARLFYNLAVQRKRNYMNKLLIMCLSTTLTLSLATVQAAEKEKKTTKVDTSKLPPPASATGVTYAKDIKPILDKSCIKCHGSEKQKGKLRLDSLEAALKCGEDGKVVLPRA